MSLCAILGEDWIAERAPEGARKLVVWQSTTHHVLPDCGAGHLDLAAAWG